MNTLTDLSQTLKDFYPLPGSRIKQYVVDTYRERAWEDATCPRFNVDPHDDNTEMSCRNVGSTRWTHLAHDCCAVCDDLHERAATEPTVTAWLAEKAKRPLIEPDHTKLSDEIAENPATREHPWHAMLPRKR